ncbi:hypothetical protein AB4571_02690 [Vibrio breoganii]|uniref:hypothetical protein n=1 Tax=Vibrio breoganii TaxID=553239 RepID=UPI000C851A45|nr:hypothetical protein [Vibrio breoganii]PML13955.1 hypothetical protein BCT84_12405 [Vibrio breoganii]
MRELEAVRLAFNYNRVDIEKDGDFSGKSISHNTIPVLNKVGERVYYPFAGSISSHLLSDKQLVKVVCLVAYTFDAKDELRREWIEIPMERFYAIGVYEHGSIRLAVDAGGLLLRELPLEVKASAEVVDISQFRRKE